MSGSLYSFDTLYHYFYKSTILHIKEIDEMLKEVKNNIIICGDFNEESSGNCYHHLKEKGFLNSMDINDNKITWYWKLGYFELKRSYDHIYYDDNFYCSSCITLTKYKNVSDHLPVVSVFELKY
jgi:endonuclease/exonuclease/phosphatase family metal-dependent hydrolase